MKQMELKQVECRAKNIFVFFSCLYMISFIEILLCNVIRKESSIAREQSFLSLKKN